MQVLANTTRGGLTNLLYTGHIAITDVDGRILAHSGDPYYVCFARSSAKTMQALCVMESGAADHYGLEQHELSMLNASHSGEDYHVATVRAMLAKAGLDESYLQCGQHYPFHEPTADAMKARGELPQPVHCNCSGKHAGMLLTAKHLGESLEDYYVPEHPVQQRILQSIADICCYEKDEILLSKDGCGVPVHALPLANWARGYARLSKPELLGEKRGEMVRKLTDAMRAYPKYMSGTDRICAKLMEHLGDRLFAKAGADCFYAIGLVDQGIGIALKMDNAPNPVMSLVTVEILRQFGVIKKEEEALFAEELNQPILNHKQEIVGATRPAFSLLRG